MNAADLTTGSVVDRYTILRVLGEGGMAIVYQVEHNQLGSKHALKVLTIASRQIRERLLLEGRAQATLRHPNVVTVTDVVDIGGAPGLIMEYIEGPSLDDYLEAQKLSIEQVDHLVRGILAGVAAAHDAGLVHRDLKPANIMLSIASGGLQPKVTDFGLAKIVAQGDQSKTRTGSTMGTPHYMSPEQIDDSKNVGPSTDIWALGAIFYEMLSGQRTFPGDNLLAIFSAVNRGEYTPIDALVPDVPDRMKAAIDAALHRDVTARPASVQELYAIWTGGEAGSIGSSQPPMGPWDAGAISQARSVAAGNATWAENSGGSGGTLADGSTSLISSKAALIGVGGTLLGIGALAVALVALVVAGVGVYFVATMEPDVQVVEKVVEVPGAPIPVPVPVEATNDGAEEPVGQPAKGGPATERRPVHTTTEDGPAPATVEPAAAEPPPEPEEPVAAAEEPEEAPAAEATDTGDATAAVEAPSEPEPEPEPATDTGTLTLGLLASPNPDDRLKSIKRKLGSPNEDTSRAFFEVLKNDQNSKVKVAALDGLIVLWDNAQGHWQTNNDAMVFAMAMGTTYALPATAAYGRNGRKPEGLKPALKSSNADVRKAAIDAAEAVVPRAPAGFDGRGFIEPYTHDPDSTVAKKAERLMKSL